MLPPHLQKKVKQYYVEIKTFPHFGEKGVPFGSVRTREDGTRERQFILLDCAHGEHTVWLTRADI